MPAATRLGDDCTGHGTFPPRPSISGSPDVATNGKPQMRVSDTYDSHCNSDGVCHGGALAQGSGSVFVNGKPAGRIGDSVDCGSSVSVGSGNVFIGG